MVSPTVLDERVRRLINYLIRVVKLLCFHCSIDQRNDGRRTQRGLQPCSAVLSAIVSGTRDEGGSLGEGGSKRAPPRATFDLGKDYRRRA